jgi:hypothetical protein
METKIKVVKIVVIRTLLDVFIGRQHFPCHHRGQGVLQFRQRERLLGRRAEITQGMGSGEPRHKGAIVEPSIQ